MPLGYAFSNICTRETSNKSPMIGEDFFPDSDQDSFSVNLLCLERIYFHERLEPWRYRGFQLTVKPLS